MRSTFSFQVPTISADEFHLGHKGIISAWKVVIDDKWYPYPKVVTPVTNYNVYFGDKNIDIDFRYKKDLVVKNKKNAQIEWVSYDEDVYIDIWPEENDIVFTANGVVDNYRVAELTAKIETKCYKTKSLEGRERTTCEVHVAPKKNYFKPQHVCSEKKLVEEFLKTPVTCKVRPGEAVLYINTPLPESDIEKAVIDTIATTLAPVNIIDRVIREQVREAAEELAETLDDRFKRYLVRNIDVPMPNVSTEWDTLTFYYKGRLW